MMAAIGIGRQKFNLFFGFTADTAHGRGDTKGALPFGRRASSGAGIAGTGGFTPLMETINAVKCNLAKPVPLAPHGRTAHLLMYYEHTHYSAAISRFCRYKCILP